MPLANGGILIIDEFYKLPVEETKKLLKLLEPHPVSKIPTNKNNNKYLIFFIMHL